MSGPSGHEREPDQAALDELERAFADEHHAEPAGAPTEAPGPSVPELDERQDADADGSTGPVAPSVDPPSGDPSVDVAPGDPDDPEVVDGLRDVGEARNPEPLDHVDDVGVPDDSSTGIAAGEPLAFGGLGGLSEAGDPDALEGLDAHDEFDEFGQFDDDDHPEQILIVEAEPVADPSASAPNIIRIDDFSGSVAIDDARGDRVGAEGAAPPTPVVDADDRRDQQQSGDGRFDRDRDRRRGDARRGLRRGQPRSIRSALDRVHRGRRHR